jgi:hypothetical protein
VELSITGVISRPGSEDLVKTIALDERIWLRLRYLNNKNSILQLGRNSIPIYLGRIGWVPQSLKLSDCWLEIASGFQVDRTVIVQYFQYFCVYLPQLQPS